MPDFSNNRKIDGGRISSAAWPSAHPGDRPWTPAGRQTTARRTAPPRRPAGAVESRPESNNPRS